MAPDLRGYREAPVAGLPPEWPGSQRRETRGTDIVERMAKFAAVGYEIMQARQGLGLVAGLKECPTRRQVDPDQHGKWFGAPRALTPRRGSFVPPTNAPSMNQVNRGCSGKQFSLRTHQ